MIIAIGIDSVEVDRFGHWIEKNETQLQKVFHKKEIDYCISNKTLAAERFAVRFAAKEAFFKALQVMGAQHNITVAHRLAPVQQAVYVAKNNKNIPSLIISWDAISSDCQKTPQVHLSLTHTRSTATAFVILENRP